LQVVPHATWVHQARTIRQEKSRMQLL